MIDIKISEQLKSKWVQIAIGSVQCDIVVKPSDQELMVELDQACNNFFNQHINQAND